MSSVKKFKSLLTPGAFFCTFLIACTLALLIIGSFVKSLPRFIPPDAPQKASLETRDGCFYRHVPSRKRPPNTISILANELDCLDAPEMAELATGKFTSSAQKKVEAALALYDSEVKTYQTQLAKLEEAKKFAIKYPTSSWERASASLELDLEDGYYYYVATPTIPRHVSTYPPETGKALQILRNKSKVATSSSATPSP